jgi:hypothetical protein
MKIKYHIIILISLITFLYVSCKKRDNVLPEIKLVGTSVDTIILNEKLIDPGANAVDDIDGNVSANIQSDYLTLINKDSAGTYEVTYTVSDKTGNINSIKRTVVVINQAFKWAGTYNAIDTFSDQSGIVRKTYQLVLVPDFFKNKKIYLKQFGNFKYNNAPINLVGYLVNIPDSASNFTKMEIPVPEKDLPPLTFGPAGTCQTKTHRFRSAAPFYLNNNPRGFTFYYEDQVISPVSCTYISYGFVTCKQ